jgi:hypothetical protein
VPRLSHTFSLLQLVQISYQEFNFQNPGIFVSFEDPDQRLADDADETRGYMSRYQMRKDTTCVYLIMIGTLEITSIH